MESLQNLTTAKPKTDKPDLTAKQLLYIDFTALGGLMTADDGEVKAMPAVQFAAEIGVSRQTLYDWQKSIPDFWDKVAGRRKELGGQARIQKVWNGVYLKAAGGNPQAAALWLANFDADFRMPAQKVEHEMGNSWAALLENKRKVIEATTVDEPAPDNS